MKNTLKGKKITAAIAALTIVSACFFGCGAGDNITSVEVSLYTDTTEWTIPEDLSTKDAFNYEQTADLSPISAVASPGKSGVLLVTMSDLEETSCHTYRQKNAISAGYRGILKQAFGTSEFSKPLPVVFKWAAETKKGAKPVKYIFKLSNNKDMTNPKVIETEDTVVPVYNLLLGTTYYWNVASVMEDGSKYESETVKFTTDKTAPRNLFIDGVTNCRDLGGWAAADGKSVKQEMVYRTARMNDNGEDTVTILPEGIAWLVNEAKIRTEIDFREGETRTTSALGDTVNYVNIPIKGTVVNQLRNYDSEMQRVIKMFAVEDNYPILFHCSLGTDRTGLVAFLINGLLGVSEDDLYMDYVFSNMGDIGSLRKADEIKESYVRVLEGFGKDTMAANIEAYMKEIGVTAEEIDSIKRILVK